MQILDLKDLFARKEELVNQTVTVQGWIRNHRKQKTFGFMDFFDGTQLESIQIVYDDANPDFAAIAAMRNGSAITVTGTLVLNDRGNYEIQAQTVTLEGDCPEDYPLQPKRHSIEFLREIAYLRPRTRLFQAVFRRLCFFLSMRMQKPQLH